MFMQLARKYSTASSKKIKRIKLYIKLFQIMEGKKMDDKQLIQVLVDYIAQEKKVKDAIKALQAGDAQTALNTLNS
jgi:hypothetical protein